MPHLTGQNAKELLLEVSAEVAKHPIPFLRATHMLARPGKPRSRAMGAARLRMLVMPHLVI